MPRRPRGRPRKRDTRMDAALDAMRQYEFDPELVRETVKELLDVYSEEGWPFIEEYAYKLLIDTIIDKGESKEAEAENKVDSPQGNASHHVNNTPSTEPQREVAPDCSNIQMSNTASQTHEHVDTASQTNEAQESASLGSKVHDPAAPSYEAHDHASSANESVVKISLPPQAEDKGVVSEDLNSEQNIHKKQTHTSLENHNDVSEHPRTAPAYKLSFPVRPRHGWIDSNKELDFVELTPSPLPESLRRMLDRVDGLFTLANEKKRKSRWDVRPEDTM